MSLKNNIGRENSDSGGRRIPLLFPSFPRPHGVPPRGGSPLAQRAQVCYNGHGSRPEGIARVLPGPLETAKYCLYRLDPYDRDVTP